MNKDTFSRHEVVEIINELLQKPDLLADVIHNGDTDWDAESLLDFIYSEMMYIEQEIQDKYRN